MDLRAFFANGISRPAKEWALLCEKCETLAPERGVSSTRHGYAFIQRKTARKMQTEHPPLTAARVVESTPLALPLWRRGRVLIALDRQRDDESVREIAHLD
jgi:hypothetical protein